MMNSFGPLWALLDDYKAQSGTAMIQKPKKWLGYCVFAVLLTAALLYIRFPSDAVVDFLKIRAGRANPPLSLSIGRLEPSILLGLKLEQVKLALKDAADRVVFQADRLLIRPGLLSYFGGSSSYSFDASAYKGEMKGHIEFKGGEAVSNMDAQIALSNIRIGDYSYLSSLMGRPVEGTMGGTVSFTGPSKNPGTAGSGEAKLTVVDGRLELLQPFLTFESIDFKEMDMDLVLQQGRINVSRLDIKGEQMQGTLSGMILLKDDLANSTLNLKGTIEPFAAFFESTGGTRDTVAFFRQRLKQGTLSFVIQGTLEAPDFKFT